MKKNFLRIFVVLFIACLISGCGNSAKTETQKTENVTEEINKKLSKIQSQMKPDMNSQEIMRVFINVLFQDLRELKSNEIEDIYSKISYTEIEKRKKDLGISNETLDSKYQVASKEIKEKNGSDYYYIPMDFKITERDLKSGEKVHAEYISCYARGNIFKISKYESQEKLAEFVNEGVVNELSPKNNKSKFTFYLTTGSFSSAEDKLNFQRDFTYIIKHLDLSMIQ